MILSRLSLFLVNWYLSILQWCVPVAAQNCIELEANETQNYFDSHDTFGFFDYPVDYERCWIITAPSGKVVHLWTMDNLELDEAGNGCNDKVRAFCGNSASSDRKIGRYCDGDMTNITSAGERMYVEFTSDSSGTSDGFRLFFQEKGSSNCENSCDECPNCRRECDTGCPGWCIAVVCICIIIVIVIVCVIIIVIVKCCIKEKKCKIVILVILIIIKIILIIIIITLPVVYCGTSCRRECS